MRKGVWTKGRYEQKWWKGRKEEVNITEKVNVNGETENCRK